jgi:hypothetical protein
MIGVEIDKQAIANIIKRIDSKFAEPAMQATIKSMGTYGYGLAKKYLKPEDEARSADYAPKSMRYDVMPLEAKIYSVMAEHRARSIEQGRAPGETLPIKAVYRWYNGTLYVRNTTIEAWATMSAGRFTKSEATSSAWVLKASGSSARHGTS